MINRLQGGYGQKFIGSIKTDGPSVSLHVVKPRHDSSSVTYFHLFNVDEEKDKAAGMGPGFKSIVAIAAALCQDDSAKDPKAHEGGWLCQAEALSAFMHDRRQEAHQQAE